MTKLTADTHATLAPWRRAGLGLPTIVGLVLSLGMLAYVRFLNRAVRQVFGAGDDPQLIHRIGSQLLSDWLIVGVLLAIVLFSEKLPLRSIGWKQFARRDLVLVGAIWAIAMAAAVLSHGGGLAGTTPVEGIFALPIWFRALMLITASITEEVIYRGYPIERLTALTGNVWIAGAVTWIAFSATHVPFFGVRSVLVAQAPGALAITFLYIRTRSLPAVILVHFLLNAGILLPASVVR